MSESKAEIKKIPTKWEGIWDLPTVYANELIISFAGGREFYLVFGEVELPMIVNRELEEIPDTVKIRPVAKIAVTPDMMIRFAEVISRHVSNFVNIETVDENEDVLEDDKDDE